MAGLHLKGRATFAAGSEHQLLPIASSAPPSPAPAEAVEAEPTCGGTGTGQHGLAPKAGGNSVAELVCPGSMAAQQGDGELP